MTGEISVLLVAHDEPAGRQTPGEFGRSDWPAELALVLEKHGWPEVEVAGPQALEDDAALVRHAAVIVGWLPQEMWRPEYVASLRNYEGVLLLEGPFPADVEAMLEDERSQQPRPPTTARPAVPQTCPLGRSAARAALSTVLDYGERFARDRRYFDNPVQDALALLSCVRCLAALSDDASREELGQLVREAAGSSRPPVAQTDAGSARARAIWGVALAEAATALQDWTFAERAKEILVGVRGGWHVTRPPDPELTRWQVMLALHLTELGGGLGHAHAHARAHGHGHAHALVSALIEASERPVADRPSPLVVWLDVELRARLDDDARSPALPGERWLSCVAAALAASSGPLPGQFDGLTLPGLMMLLGAMRQAGHRPAARRLWRVLYEGGYEADHGFFQAARVVGGQLVPTAGVARAPALALGLLSAARPVDFIDGAVDAPGSQPPAIWRRGNVIATASQLLHLVHDHTAASWEGPNAGDQAVNAGALEHLLAGLLSRAQAAWLSRPET